MAVNEDTMALINCPTCGELISSEAATCFGCGAPIRASTMPNIYLNKCFGNAIMLFGVVVLFVGFPLSVWYVYGHRGDEYQLCTLLIGAFWVISPPVWFFFEHFFLFRCYGDPRQYDQFKREQELASKIWAGVVIVLAALYTSSFPK